MALHPIGSQFGSGGTGIPSLGKVLGELSRLQVSVAAGAAAGTKMDVAALRAEDTILSALVFDAGVPSAGNLANITIQDTHAFGTVTVAAPVANDTVTVNGVTYTFKAAPTLLNEVKVVTGDNNAMAENLKNAILAYETRYLGTVGNSNGSNVAAVRVSRNNAVLTITAVVDGAAGNAITLLSSNGTRLAVTGSGTLTSGTNTGGFKSTDNLASKQVVVVWFDKNA